MFPKYVSFVNKNQKPKQMNHLSHSIMRRKVEK